MLYVQAIHTYLPRSRYINTEDCHSQMYSHWLSNNNFNTQPRPNFSDLACLDNMATKTQSAFLHNAVVDQFLKMLREPNGSYELWSQFIRVFCVADYGKRLEHLLMHAFIWDADLDSVDSLLAEAKGMRVDFADELDGQIESLSVYRGDTSDFVTRISSLRAQWDAPYDTNVRQYYKVDPTTGTFHRPTTTQPAGPASSDKGARKRRLSEVGEETESGPSKKQMT